MDYLGVEIDIITTGAEAEIAEVQSKVDAVVAGWKVNRQEIMRGLSVVNQFVAITARIAQHTGDAVGKCMLRILQSLLSVIGSTASTMIALAAAYIATGILAPVGLILAAFATGLSIGDAAAVITAQAQLLAQMESVNSRLAALEGFRAQMGGFM